MAGRRYTLSTFKYAPAHWQVLAHGGGGIPAALGARPWLRLLVPFFIASMVWHCFWQARRAEIIFANWSVCGVVAGVVGRLLGRPVVTTVRGEDANRADASLLHRLLIALCLRLGQRVVTVSDDIANSLKKLFPTMADRVVMIPNGVDMAVTNDNADQRSDNTVMILMIGSLIPRKSVQTALQALVKLPANFRLTVLGDGPERGRLEMLVDTLALSDRVNLVGHVPPDEVRHWLTRADVLVMTSRSEGRPNAVLEAMAAGLPVVGSDIPGMRELVLPGVSGVLFPVGDDSALANALLPLADKTLRGRLGERARCLIDERGLTWKNCAVRYLQQFEQLMAKGLV
jgi:glycosyltransferase involved in cell wall biosynthesis